MRSEADTCRKFVVPRLQPAGWDNEPHRLNEQVTFTDGRIIVTGRKARRRPGQRADYIEIIGGIDPLLFEGRP
jgi:type I restriction enzyme R subunit